MILIEIAGYLGSDPEERYTATGKRVVGLRVATHIHHAGHDETLWWRVSIWGERYDKMLPYLKKGSAVIIVGEMGKPETYVSKDGTTQISLSLTAEIIKFSPFGRSDRVSEKQAEPSTETSFVPNASSTPDSSSNKDSFATVGAGTEGDNTLASDDLTSDDLPF